MKISLVFKTVGFSIVFALSLVVAKAQDGFDTLFNKLENQYPQEKVYIHYDRAYYNPGETIWYKAYVFSGNRPSLISSTLYTELINEKGVLIDRKTLPLQGSSTASFFDLPDSLKSSVLYVRAYTSWMQNFDSSFLYVKPIKIILPTAASFVKKDPVYSLSFFPEGGDMFNGISSRIAFKANDDQGFPFKIAGDILNSKGQKVAAFSSVHDGMGFFILKPVAGEKYKAVWKDNKGTAKETVLPDAKQKGVSLSVNNNGSLLTYTLKRSADVPDNYKTVHLVAHIQQEVVYIAKLNLSTKDSVTAPIDIGDTRDGILQVTLFTEDKIPIAERIVFIDQGNYFFFTDLHTTTKNLAAKGKNTIQLDVGDTLLTNLSVAVTDVATNTPSDEEETIFSHVLLSSDIKGFVYNPAYYFSGTADSLKQHLDLVMMTNGWRRFKWQDIVNDKWPQIKYMPQPYITVKGNVLGLQPSVLSQGQQLSVIMTTGKENKQFMVIPVNKNGEFELKDMIFYDTAKLYYQLSNDKDKRMTTMASFQFRNNFLLGPNKPLANLKSFFKPVLPDTALQRKNSFANRMRLEEFINGQKVKELEGVKVTATIKSPQEKMDEEYTSGFFKGGDSRTFIVEDDNAAKSMMSVLMYLQGRVAGLQVTMNGNTGGSLTWRNSSTAVFLNEVQTDISMIQTLSMNDIAMIKVFPPIFYGASGGAGAGGAVAVYTKKGKANNEDVKGLSFVSISGYSAMKEFYSPDYTKPEEKAKSDFRTTLYWNPYVVFDKNNRRALLSFYNNDNAKKLRVIVEGVNQDGQLTREEKIIE